MRLPPRWTSLHPHPKGEAYSRSTHRFNVVPAGRRSGKTERAKRKVVMQALVGTAYDPARFFLAAPTRDQAKRIFWDDLKKMVPWALIQKAYETELMVRTPMAEVWVIGMDKPQRMEGTPWDGGVLDEYGNMRPRAWTENVRPGLADRHGWCDFIGVPEGRNHYYDLWTEAMAEFMAKGEASEWGAFTWHSSDVVDAQEVEAARRSMDALTFAQEFEASFVNFVGRAYYPFDRAVHCQPLRYSPSNALVFCFDFNVDPGVAAICQEQILPSGIEGTGVIGEVFIPRNSNTPAVCRKLLQDYGAHMGPVRVYGDATGGNRGTAKVQGSDWDLVHEILTPAFRGHISFHVPNGNPPERARINAVNSRLLSADGMVRLMVDPVRAPHVAKDLEGVRLLEGGSGEIEKKSGSDLTHLSDALGYYVWKEYPLRSQGTQVATFSA